MCNLKKYHKTSNTQIDKCMKPLIDWLNRTTHYKIVACCCGHNKYPMTIVVKTKDIVKWTGKEFFYWELFTRTHIPRTRRFYKKDKQGYYFIPEVI